ncbi:MAG: sulfatase-like hydrolase/transferase [candidate division KSB1 bacterium]|nr:sulfatase-like hydrolase/transferase [candidate division KSB1 bacterium]
MLPLFAPDEFFDLYKLDEIELVKIKKDDLNDIFPQGKESYTSNTIHWGFMKYERLTRTDRDQALREWTQAYLANVSFLDAQIGKILDALENSRYAENTLVLFTSDHGYHLGEKNWLFKNSVWEESTRVPFVAAGPGLEAGSECRQPVSLIDIYPTLTDYCGLPGNPHAQTSGFELDGQSLVPLFKSKRPDEFDDYYALTAVGGLNQTEDTQVKLNRSHYTLRTDRYRYTRHGDGIRELYDHRNDPHEWNNLAGKPEYKDIEKQLSERLQSIVWNNKKPDFGL